MLMMPDVVVGMSCSYCYCLPCDTNADADV